MSSLSFKSQPTDLCNDTPSSQRAAVEGRKSRKQRYLTDPEEKALKNFVLRFAKKWLSFATEAFNPKKWGPVKAGFAFI